MPASPSPIHGRGLEALRACWVSPQGLQPAAYPSVMPTLEAMGLVARRQAAGNGRRTIAWFLTDAGRKAMRELGTGEPAERS